MAPIHGTYQSAGLSPPLSDSPTPSTSIAVAPSNSGGYTQRPLGALDLLPPGLTPHICMWDGCGVSFDSLSGLVGHVNLQHLRITSTPPFSSKPLTDSITLPASFHHQSLPLKTDTNISCHWDNCDRYHSLNNIPGPSSLASDYEVEMNILASHLLQDHLGLQTDLAFPSKPAPGDMVIEDIPLNSLSTPPDSSSVPSVDSPEPRAHECCGVHPCRWQSCSQTFSSCDELTAHIALVHVGAGKAQYECFWEGCKRNGEEGFSSKQKICRHLQVSDFFLCVCMGIAKLIAGQSHTGHRPFQCNICKQNFSEVATLQQHMRRHTHES